MYTSRPLVFAALLCLVTVQARHHAERSSDTEELTNGRSEDAPEQHRRLRDDSQMRHRGKRWQSYGGYDYRQPSIPFYENDRRDYMQPDIHAQILRLLDEIASYVKRPPPPPPPPQPIYIPYPVPYPVVSQQCDCGPKRGNNTFIPQLPPRFPEMDDANQNWGIDNSNDDSENGVYDRPVNFTPIKPDQASFTTSTPLKDRPVKSGPGRCAAAVLSCCRPTDTAQKQYACFVNLNCKGRYSSTACSKESVNSVIELFSKAYSPV